MNKDKWLEFKYAVLEARALFTTINGFDIFINIRVHIGKAVFDLNPFLVDLRTKKYMYGRKEINLMSGRKKFPNLREFMKEDSKWILDWYY